MIRKLEAVLSIVALALLACAAAPRDASALWNITGPDPFGVSIEARNRCLAAGGSYWKCEQWANIVDPSGADITGLAITMQYDSSLYTFNQAQSGPLGMFSVGGDAPPPNPGSGTQPLELLPGTGYSPGSPLPGSTLNWTVGSNTVTLDYQFASPVTLTGDTNVFIFMFDYINPVLIDLAASTVTYNAAGPGTDLTVTNAICTTVSDEFCGSGTPGTGISFNLAIVPEPGSLSILLAALGGLAGLRKYRRRIYRTV